MEKQKTNNIRWEIGSDFHWTGIPDGPHLPWPQPNRWFALGRDAMMALWQRNASPGTSTLFVPDYFCPEVLSCWSARGIKLGHYHDNPQKRQPDFTSLAPEPGDMVLAVNYFGVREKHAWQSWHAQDRNVLLIEDHSHDPLSAWARDSEADYAFASLRKTFPAPDGALLWSPSGKTLPEEPAGQNWQGSALKLASMMFKKDFFNGGIQQIKNIYRSFQVESERIYSASDSILSISPWSRQLLCSGYPVAWRQQREKNLRQLLHLMADAATKGFAPLFTSWPDNHCPYGLILVFDEPQTRDKFRRQLIENNIYASIHWGHEKMKLGDSVNLSQRLLTLLIDQRYNSEDMEKIFHILTKIV
jgi:hypothetical protein